MSELSEPLKNFLTEFKVSVLPHISKTDSPSAVVCYVSGAALADPQLRELLGVTPGNKHGEFLGVSVHPKGDMTVEVFPGEKE